MDNRESGRADTITHTGENNRRTLPLLDTLLPLAPVIFQLAWAFEPVFSLVGLSDHVQSLTARLESPDSE
nr:hypothetical protein [Anaerolineae bacterium]